MPWTCAVTETLVQTNQLLEIFHQKCTHFSRRISASFDYHLLAHVIPWCSFLQNISCACLHFWCSKEQMTPNRRSESEHQRVTYPTVCLIYCFIQSNWVQAGLSQKSVVAKHRRRARSFSFSSCHWFSAPALFASQLLPPVSVQSLNHCCSSD